MVPSQVHFCYTTMGTLFFYFFFPASVTSVMGTTIFHCFPPLSPFHFVGYPLFPKRPTWPPTWSELPPSLLVPKEPRDSALTELYYKQKHFNNSPLSVKHSQSQGPTLGNTRCSFSHSLTLPPQGVLTPLQKSLMTEVVPPKL